MDIANSISIYFNFGKGHYFVLKVKQNIFGKARIFQMNRINSAIILIIAEFISLVKTKEKKK